LLKQRQNNPDTKTENSVKPQTVQPEPKRAQRPRPRPKPRPRVDVRVVGKVPPTPNEDALKWEEAYVIGGGPSLTGFDWKLLKGKFVVGINRAYEVLPEAQIIYFTDDDWYDLHKRQGLHKHKGRLIKGSLNPSKLKQDKHIEQMHLTGEKGLDLTPGKLKHGRNSTYAVMNMLIQWGFKRIYLMGVDMKHQGVMKKGKGSKTHWHSGHKRIDGPATYKVMSRNFSEVAGEIKKLDVEVINLNNDTDLKAFPIKPYESVFGPECFRKG
jgi:hypothetical protein